MFDALIQDCQRFDPTANRQRKTKAKRNKQRLHSTAAALATAATATASTSASFPCALLLFTRSLVPHSSSRISATATAASAADDQTDSVDGGSGGSTRHRSRCIDLCTALHYNAAACVERSDRISRAVLPAPLFHCSVLAVSSAPGRHGCGRAGRRRPQRQRQRAAE